MFTFQTFSMHYIHITRVLLKTHLTNKISEMFIQYFFFVLWKYCIECQVVFTSFSFTNSIQAILVPYNLFIWFFSLLKCCLCSFQHSKFNKTHKTFYECCEWLCSIFFSNKDTIIYAVTTIDSLHLQNTAWLFNHA